MRRFPGMRMEIRQTTKEKIMGIFSMILSLLSGVALFLFGMSLMGDGLKMVAGNKLEAFLYRMTNTSFGGKQICSISIACCVSSGLIHLNSNLSILFVLIFISFSCYLVISCIFAICQFPI